MAPPIVTVFGSGVCDCESPGWRLAYDLGHALARAGWTLCNGGYGGTMEAAARGACDAGGHTIGVTCRIPQWSGSCNAHIRQEVPTFNLPARLDVLLHLGDAFVALPGGTGTLLELALVWEYLNKRLIGRPAPLVLLGGHWTPLIGLIEREQTGAVRPHVATDVPSAIATIRAAWAGTTRG